MHFTTDRTLIIVQESVYAIKELIVFNRPKQFGVFLFWRVSKYKGRLTAEEVNLAEKPWLNFSAGSLAVPSNRRNNYPTLNEWPLEVLVHLSQSPVNAEIH